MAPTKSAFEQDTEGSGTLNKESRPKRERGARHLLAAASYSAAGCSRLCKETAFRHEAVAAGLVLAAHVLIGSDIGTLVVAAMLILATFAVEALNTAVEAVVDDLSPDWSEAAKHAKDLGSFAVLCLLLCNAAWLGFAVHAAFSGTG